MKTEEEWIEYAKDKAELDINILVVVFWVLLPMFGVFLYATGLNKPIDIGAVAIGTKLYLFLASVFDEGALKAIVQGLFTAFLWIIMLLPVYLRKG